MKIEKIEWISRAGQEAEVHLSSGGYRCIAFCQPCEYEEGASVTEALHAFMTKEVMLSRDEDASLNWLGGSSLVHKCTARVVDVAHALVSVGDIKIELDGSIPAGVNAGDLIDFKCARLDLW
jgi:hypothetical protein